MLKQSNIHLMSEWFKLFLFDIEIYKICHLLSIFHEMDRYFDNGWYKGLILKLKLSENLEYLEIFQRLFKTFSHVDIKEQF